MSHARNLFATWEATQGAKIREARSLATYGACASAVKRMCRQASERHQMILLTAANIATCEMRALTSARNVKFGPPPADAEVWQQQLDQVRADWAAATS